MSACRAELELFDCGFCGGMDIVTRPGAELARAELCTHLQGCTTCRDSGFRRARDADGYEVMQPCALQRLRRRVEMFDRASIPTRYHDASFDTYEARGGNQSQIMFRFKGLVHELEKSVQPGGRLPRGIRGIGLSGPPGTGKTHLMTAMARHLVLDLGVPVRFTDFSALLWALKAGFAAGQGEDALIAPLVEVEVLFIDELGKGRASEWEIGVLDALVCERYNRKLTTFFATNHPLTEAAPTANFNAARDRVDRPQPDSLVSRTHPRIVSRLAEMCDLLTLDGPDSRQLAAATATQRQPTVPRPASARGPR